MGLPEVALTPRGGAAPRSDFRVLGNLVVFGDMQEVVLELF